MYDLKEPDRIAFTRSLTQRELAIIGLPILLALIISIGAYRLISQSGPSKSTRLHSASNQVEAQENLPTPDSLEPLLENETPSPSASPSASPEDNHPTPTPSPSSSPSPKPSSFSDQSSLSIFGLSLDSLFGTIILNPYLAAVEAFTQGSSYPLGDEDLGEYQEMYRFYVTRNNEKEEGSLTYQVIDEKGETLVLFHGKVPAGSATTDLGTRKRKLVFESRDEKKIVLPGHNTGGKYTAEIIVEQGSSASKRNISLLIKNSSDETVLERQVGRTSSIPLSTSNSFVYVKD